MEETQELFKNITEFINNYVYNSSINNILSIRTSDYKSIDIEIETRYDAICLLMTLSMEGYTTLIGTYSASIGIIKEYKQRLHELTDIILDGITEVAKITSFKTPFTIIPFSKTSKEEQTECSSYNNNKYKSTIFNLKKKIYKKKFKFENLPSICTKLMSTNDTMEIQFSIHNDYANDNCYAYLYIDKYVDMKGFDCLDCYVIRKDFNDTMSLLRDDDKNLCIAHYMLSNTSLSMDEVLCSDEDEYKIDIEIFISDAVVCILDFLKKLGNGKIKYKIYTYKGGEQK